MNYFAGQIGLPNHLSIGAVVVRGDGKVCCHHFVEKSGYKDLYILMRETIEPDETIVQALARGLHEEFNIEAKLIDYLGAIISKHEEADRNIEKTTLYFLCKYIREKDTTRNTEDPEGDSLIEWIEPNELIKFMKDQFARYDREDIDESAVVKKIIN